MQDPKGETLATIGSDQWPRVKAIFHDALDRPPVQRTGFIEHACQGDAVLLRMVQSLLASDRSADRFMEAPAAARIALGPSAGSIARGDLTTNLDVARPTGSTSTQSLEIQALLRYRLRIIALIGLPGNALFTTLRFLRHDLTPTII